MPKWLDHMATNPNSVPIEEQWREQWNRVSRWYQECNKIQDKHLRSALTLHDQDILISFFQNCYHLQDWITCSRSDLKLIVKKFMDETFEMILCRNISDGFKHMELTNPKHPDPDFNWEVLLDFFELETASTDSGMRHVLTFRNGDEINSYDVFELINQCFHLWESFIKYNSLEA